MTTVTITNDTWLEVSNILDGTFAPLTGFCSSADYKSTVNDMHLQNGAVWSIPITLDVPQEQKAEIEKADKLTLLDASGESVASVQVEEVYDVDLRETVQKVYGTDDTDHPGVARELSRSPLRVAGKPELLQKVPPMFPDDEFSPAETKKIFKEKGWTTVAGFQTRNPPHRAHEYLQRVAMEICDGIFLQPLIGWKKPDDIAPGAVMEAYRTLASEFYPESHALLGALRTPMRYAGPREAVFHAIIRRNHGCTHFIIGRDHAGVGNYYKTYEAQELACSLTNLGIEILALKEPYYCAKSGCIVTEKTSRHPKEESAGVSGTRMRELLSKGERPPENFMRPEISDVLINLAKKNELFVGEK